MLSRAPSSLGRVEGPERGSSGAQGHHGLTGTPPDGSELVHVAGGRWQGQRHLLAWFRVMIAELSGLRVAATPVGLEGDSSRS